jgi:hypothetical protein
MNAKEIDENKFRELIGKLDLERVMGESVAEGPATTQDEEAGESEQEESVEEELAVVEKGIELSTVGKGKRKAVPARAKVYAVMDEPVSRLIKSTSICANTFAYRATDVSCGRQSPSASQICMSDAARSVRPTRVDALGGGRVEKSSRGRSQPPTRGLGVSW